MTERGRSRLFIEAAEALESEMREMWQFNRVGNGWIADSAEAEYNHYANLAEGLRAEASKHG